jgi:GAF domain-containing protein
VADNVLTLAVRGERDWFTVASDSDQLPTDFRVALRSTSTTVVVPLSARDHPIGVLVADNKFTLAPINENDVGALMTFANTAAMAVDNIRLFQRLQDGHRKLRSLFTARGLGGRVMPGVRRWPLGHALY